MPTWRLRRDCWQTRTGFVVVPEHPPAQSLADGGFDSFYQFRNVPGEVADLGTRDPESDCSLVAPAVGNVEALEKLAQIIQFPPAGTAQAELHEIPVLGVVVVGHEPELAALFRKPVGDGPGAGD